jgi:hypothetical protein
MQFSILLLPLLGGAIYCRAVTRFRYRFYRRRGHDLFFTAATVGVFLLVAAFSFTKLILLLECGQALNSFWDSATPNIPYLGVSVISFAMGFLGYLIDSIKFGFLPDKVELIWREIDRFGTELELLVFKSVVSLEDTKKEEVDNLPNYMVTLENGKVFIGFITSAPDPYGDRNYLRMTKVFSGYRTEERDVKIVSRYDSLLVDECHEARDFEVAIQLSRVVHVTPFNPSILNLP